MLEHAASIIRTAEAFVLTAGAGMGVDSGLPDFSRGSRFLEGVRKIDALL